MVDREAEVQRLALTLAVAATMVCYGSATRAQAGTAFYPVAFAACQPLPPWYPRGWELMVRYPCVTYVPGASYYPPAYYPYPAVYPHQRVSIHATHRVHRRPYLRPGWWWWGCGRAFVAAGAFFSCRASPADAAVAVRRPSGPV